MINNSFKYGGEVLKNRLFLAPMAGISDESFRRVCYEHGAALLYSEMLSADALIYKSIPTIKMLKLCISEKPVNVQIFGSDPKILAKAAKICVGYGAKMIDVNMGCPVRKVFNKGAGSALMASPLRVSEIVKSVRSAVSVPLSVKIRSGINKSSINAVEIAKILESEGVDMICVHPRTKLQAFSGDADWSIIRDVKLKVKIPVVGNGDLKNRADAIKMLEETNCDMFMIGRELRGAPWLFLEILKGVEIDNETRYKVILRHLANIIEEYGEMSGVKMFRKHLCWYIKGFFDAALFRHRLVSVNLGSDVRKILEEIFCDSYCIK